jgi:hypothetical protein
LAEEKGRNKNLEKYGNSKRKIDTALTLEEVDINQVTFKFNHCITDSQSI